MLIDLVCLIDSYSEQKIQTSCTVMFEPTQRGFRKVTQGSKLETVVTSASSDDDRRLADPAGTSQDPAVPADHYPHKKKQHLLITKWKSLTRDMFPTLNFILIFCKVSDKNTPSATLVIKACR